MGKPGAKKMDQIVSVTPGDVHIIMVPSPGGPVPTPIPHPCASIIKDKVAEKVKVMGQPGAVKGSISKHTPPHIPMGPGPFQKPPANKGEIVTASSNVFYEGKEAAMLGDTAKMCADPADAPVGKVIGTAATVLVGGGGSGSDEARAAAADAAMKAAAAACHKWINANMPPGADREQAHRDVCSTTGHPVDVVTGKVFTGVSLIRLTGRIPVVVKLDYSTARHQEDSAFGFGWRSTLERQLLMHPKFIAYRDQFGRFVPFPPLREGERARSLTAALVLGREGGMWRVRHPDGLEERFPVHDTERVGFRPLIAVGDPFGNETRFRYGSRGLERIEDSAGRGLRLDWTDAGRVATVTIEAEGTAPRTITRCEYDEQGDLVAVQDAAGCCRRFEYNGHLLVKETDRNGFSFYFAYDRDARCVRTWGDGGKLYRQLAYDHDRRVTVVTDGRGGQSTHYANELGVVERFVDPLGHEWTNKWDEAGHLLAQTDPCGRSWSYEYDDAGDLIARSDPAGEECLIERDQVGRITQMAYSQGATLTNVYDPPSGRLAVKRLGEKVELRYVWSLRGDLQEVWTNGKLSSRYIHDERGEMIEMVSVDGAVAHVASDDLGCQVRVSDDRGREVRLEWDAVGRLVAVRPDALPVKRWEYDAEGNRVRRLIGDAELTCRFDHWNAPAEYSGSGCRHPVRLGYDTENLPAWIETGRGGRHEFSYDACNRLVRHRHPNGSVTAYERDPGGRVAAVVDRLGRRVVMETDQVGNLVRCEGPDGSAAEWEYEGGTRLVRMSSDGVTVEGLLDEAGRRFGEVMTLPDGQSLSLLRDEDGYLCWEEGVRFFGSFQGCGGRIEGAWCAAWSDYLRVRSQEDTVTFSYPNGVIERQRFDRHDRLVDQIITGPNGAMINRRRFAYDASGEIAAIADDLRDERYFQYDAAGRLLRVTVQVAGAQDSRGASGGHKNADSSRYEVVSEEYTHDAAENTSRGAEAWEFDAACRLLRSSGARYTHDAAGQRTERVNRQGVVTRYRWDDNGRLATVEVPERGRIEFRYDAMGRRVCKTNADGEVLFGWNGDRLVTERYADGRERRYIYHGATFRLLGWVDVEGDEMRNYFVHGDHLGRPLEVTDERGRLVWAARCDAYGVVQGLLVAEVDLPLRAAGQYLDRETGLCYNRHRYFDPEVLRYISEDPLGLNGGFNPYAYCPNPLREVDPLGLTPGGNPNYDPRAAELAALRRIYGESPGLQMLTESYQPGQEWKIAVAQRMLAEETGFSIHPWVGPQGPHGREPSAADAGMVDWENRRIYIDPNVDQETYRHALGHEAGAVKIVEDDIAQTGAPRPENWEEAKERHIAPSAEYPGMLHRTQVLDNHVANPTAAEQRAPVPAGGDDEI